MPHALLRPKSFLGIQAKAAFDERCSCSYLVLVECIRKARFNWLIKPMMLSIIIFHFTVAKPFFRNIVFESSTHWGDSLGSSPFWMEESVISQWGRLNVYEHKVIPESQIDFIARDSDLPDIPTSRYQFEENMMHSAVGSLVQINNLHFLLVCNSTAGLWKRDKNPTQPAQKKIEDKPYHIPSCWDRLASQQQIFACHSI